MKNKIILFTTIVCLFCAGQIAKNHIFNDLQNISSNNEISLINHSFNNSPEISFWGSSTCSMGFIPTILEDSLNQTVYNYGLSGIQFHQQFHLQQFAFKNENKKLVLIVNPFNYFENSKSYRDENQLFMHQIDQSKVFENLKSKNLFEAYSLKHLGFYSLFKLNVKHWNQYLNHQLDTSNYNKGYSNTKHIFRHINNKYQKDVKFDDQKIQELKTLLDSIQSKHHVTVVLPPILNQSELEFLQPFERDLKPHCDNLVDYMEDSRFKDTTLFQDYIHLNHLGAQKITKDLVKHLR